MGLIPSLEALERSNYVEQGKGCLPLIVENMVHGSHVVNVAWCLFMHNGLRCSNTCARDSRATY